MLFLASCAKDVTLEDTYLDSKLKRAIEQVAQNNNLSYYVLPSEEDLAVMQSSNLAWVHLLV